MTLTVKERRDPNFPLLLEGARLYILVRTDIVQLNPGKLGAQAGHAATQFVFDTFNIGNEERLKQMHDWRAQAGGGFGTKITLAAKEAEIEEAIPYLQTEFGLPAGIVVDPTYPMTNYFGEFFTREELTCAYVFTPSNTPASALDYLRQFDLHP